MTYRIITGDRRQVVKKLEELTRKRAEYTRMPRMAYIIEGIAVEKDCTITLEEDAQMDLVERLLSAGLISAQTTTEEEETSPVESKIEEAEPPTSEEKTDQTEKENTEGEKAPTSYENLIEQEDELEAEPKEKQVTFSFPLEPHRPDSIINLISTIYTRGKLISKATGGTFFVKEDLVEHLQFSGGHTTIEALLGIIREEGGLEGLSFTEGNVIFDGFPSTADEDCTKAWKVLSENINRNAIKQTHVRAKKIDDSNEKFAFRTWLTRLGMNGPELKKERLLLYRNLSGHTAFRTSKDAERWKVRQALKRKVAGKKEVKE